MRLRPFITSLAACLALTAAAAEPKPPLRHFVWGADIGGAIDLSGHDMSTVNIDAYFGYRCSLFPVLGLGAGINIPVDNSRREIPVYAIARTSFVRRPQPVFAELRTGIVVNSHPDYASATDFFLSPGVGFRLAAGRSYTSYLIVGYIFNNLRTHDGSKVDSPDTDLGDDLSRPIRGIHSAVVRLGITF